MSDSDKQQISDIELKRKRWREASAKYKSTAKGIATRRAYEERPERRSIQRLQSREQNIKWAFKSKAVHAVNNAIQAGKLKRKPCEVCGNPRSQGHHPDYSRPLDVVWLCKKHHAALHRKYDAPKTTD